MDRENFSPSPQSFCMGQSCSPPPPLPPIRIIFSACLIVGSERKEERAATGKKRQHMRQFPSGLSRSLVFLFFFCLLPAHEIYFPAAWQRIRHSRWSPHGLQGKNSLAESANAITPGKKWQELTHLSFTWHSKDPREQLVENKSTRSNSKLWNATRQIRWINYSSTDALRNTLPDSP